MVFCNPTYPEVDMCAFVNTDLKPMHGDTKEDVPLNATAMHGKAMDLHMCVHHDHAGEGSCGAQGLVLWFT
jgi:hypothetical protein